MSVGFLMSEHRKHYKPISRKREREGESMKERERESERREREKVRSPLQFN